MEYVLVFIIVFLAIFTQTLSGFGLALVSMPLLLRVVDIQIAAPLVALVGVLAEIVLLIRYRHALSLQIVWRLLVSSLLAVPFGVLALSQVNEKLVLTILGVVVMAYGLYALSDWRLPAISHPRWAFAFGFVGGLFSGAYNTSGPPIIIYGSCRRWEPDEFKSNLQGFFLFNSVTVVVVHIFSGNMTTAVLQHYFVAVPAIILALLAGFALDKYLNPERFRQMVLVLLVILGFSLIV